MNRNLKTILAGLILGVGFGVGSYLYVPPIRSISSLIYNTTPAPVVETESETKKQEKLSREDAYPVIMSHLKNSSLVYGRLNGRFPPEAERDSVTNLEDLPFYSKREEFLKYNKNGVPISVTFRDLNTGDGMQLAYSEVFTPGAYVLLASEGNVCAPPSDEKDEAWRKLAEQFEQGGFVDKSLIDTIMRASTPDCDYLSEQWYLNKAKEKQKQILSSLENLVLEYGFLRGDYPFEMLKPSERDPSLQFYASKEEFIKNNEHGNPYSILFLTPDKKTGLRILASAGNVLFRSERGSLAFCTAPDEGRKTAWKGLVDDFEQGKPVNKELLYQIIKDKPVNEPLLCN